MRYSFKLQYVSTTESKGPLLEVRISDPSIAFHCRLGHLSAILHHLSMNYFVIQANAFAMQTNIFCNLDKYILHFETNTFCNLGKYIRSPSNSVVDTYCSLNKYLRFLYCQQSSHFSASSYFNELFVQINFDAYMFFLQFKQIHFAISTNISETWIVFDRIISCHSMKYFSPFCMNALYVLITDSTV